MKKMHLTLSIINKLFGHTFYYKNITKAISTLLLVCFIVQNSIFKHFFILKKISNKSYIRPVYEIHMLKYIHIFNYICRLFILKVCFSNDTQFDN